jgi:hypothetical protein
MARVECFCIFFNLCTGMVAFKHRSNKIYSWRSSFSTPTRFQPLFALTVTAAPQSTKLLDLLLKSRRTKYYCALHQTIYNFICWLTLRSTRNIFLSDEAFRSNELHETDVNFDFLLTEQLNLLDLQRQVLP